MQKAATQETTSLDIDVVDALWVAEEVRGGFSNKITATSVKDAIQQVLDLLKKKQATIGCLRFFGHGMPGRQGCGVGHGQDGPKHNQVDPRLHATQLKIIGISDDRRTLWNKEEIEKLSGHFYNEKTTKSDNLWDKFVKKMHGVYVGHPHVELRGCNVGYPDGGWDLMKKLASLWQVPIRAAEQEQHYGEGGYSLTNNWEGTVWELAPNQDQPRSLKPSEY